MNIHERIESIKEAIADGKNALKDPLSPLEKLSTIEFIKSCEKELNKLSLSA